MRPPTLETVMRARMKDLPFIRVCRAAILHRWDCFDQHMDAAPRHPSDRFPCRSHLHKFNVHHCSGNRTIRCIRIFVFQEVEKNVAWLSLANCSRKLFFF